MENSILFFFNFDGLPKWIVDSTELRSIILYFSELTRFPSNLVVSQRSRKIVLDLSGNNIQNLSYAVARYNEVDEAAKLFRNISKLYLSKNKIKVFHHFWLPNDLEELYLDNNDISQLQQSDINYFDSLVNRTNLRLRLGNNPYSCSCQSTPLYHFIKNRGTKVEDQHLVTLRCQDGEVLNIIMKCL